MLELFKSILRKPYYFFFSKHEAELNYWRACYRKEGNTLDNSFYKPLMLAIAQEKNEDFAYDKVVADFGCGPRGTLSWLRGARQKIGIDVLVQEYQECFPDLLSTHNMTYVACSETRIPLPDESVDILFTINALDHVQNLKIMCHELLRILKPQALLIGSFNLNEAPRKTEPQCLTESLLRNTLFRDLKIISWRVSQVPKQGYRFQPFLDNDLTPPEGKVATLWAKATKSLPQNS
ncbi:MAG: class I SAM-dependent methyltransferase [Candidatus Cloacimonetes bacterium]|nr:class I SAM-dependent methyltransferase [Candidatus Cloacimonadota bacterium]